MGVGLFFGASIQVMGTDQVSDSASGCFHICEVRTVTCNIPKTCIVDLCVCMCVATIYTGQINCSWVLYGLFRMMNRSGA